MGVIKQNSELENFLEKNICDLGQKSKSLKFDDSTLAVYWSMRETGREAVEVGELGNVVLNLCILMGV